MSAAWTLLARCRDLGATLTPGPDGKLKVRAPAPLPEELRQELKQRKAEILDLLRPGVMTCDVLTVFPGTEVLYTTPPASCRTCGANTWWVNSFNWPLCAQCFPPSLPEMVKEWIRGQDAA